MSTQLSPLQTPHLFFHNPVPQIHPPTYNVFIPPPKSSLSKDLEALIINTAIKLSLQEPAEGFIHTSEIPENPLGAPLEEITPVPEIPHPTIHPPMVLPNEPVPIPPPTLKCTNRRKGNKRSINTKTILSFGLASSNALRPLCNRYPGEPDPQCIIEIAQLEASLTTQEHHENFVCQVCTKLRHKQKFCNRYFCCICGNLHLGTSPLIAKIFMDDASSAKDLPRNDSTTTFVIWKQPTMRLPPVGSKKEKRMRLKLPSGLPTSTLILSGILIKMNELIDFILRNGGNVTRTSMVGMAPIHFPPFPCSLPIP
jgi:hypothetical protein